MERFRQKISWLNPRYGKQERSIKAYNVWIKLVKENLAKGESDFAKKVNKIIEERKIMQKCVFILCSPSRSLKEFVGENRGFWLFFNPENNHELMIQSAGRGGLSTFSYLALDHLTKSNINTTDKIIKEVLIVENMYFEVGEAVAA